MPWKTDANKITFSSILCKQNYMNVMIVPQKRKWHLQTLMYTWCTSVRAKVEKKIYAIVISRYISEFQFYFYFSLKFYFVSGYSLPPLIQHIEWTKHIKYFAVDIFFQSWLQFIRIDSSCMKSNIDSVIMIFKNKFLPSADD